MNIEYDTSLTESVVLQEIEKRERRGDPGLLNNYHEKVDPLYELDPLDREEEFENVHEQIFLDLGYGKLIKEAIEEFPLLNDKVSDIYINISLVTEEADLMKRDFDDTGDLRKIKIKIRAEMFSSPEELRMVLRHELMHVIDMLDEAYGYDTKIPALNTVEENFIRERYKILWDIYIDSRLGREGKKTIAGRDKRFSEFSVIYQKIPYSQRLVMFDNLWGRERMTHGEILGMAGDLMNMVTAVGDTSAVELVKEKKRGYQPGSPCPLCQFPTYNWAKELNLEDEDEKRLYSAIRVDFPGWEPQEGACERCVELYKFNLEESKV
jgi:hypothetical protein